MANNSLTRDQSAKATTSAKIQHYLRAYERDLAYKPDKFPGVERQDLYEKLCALYQAYVQVRGGRVSFDSETTKHIRLVTKWALESPKRALLLSGTNGNGKTTMLLSLSRLMRAKYVTAQGLETHVLNQYDLQEFYTCPILAIDDIAKESERIMVYGTPVPVIANIIRRRYALSLVTVMSSNLTIDELAERYGPDVADRFFEYVSIINFNNPSYRRNVNYLCID